MTRESSSDLLTEYVTLLREFGLRREDVRDLHADDEVREDVPLREFVGRRVDAASTEALFARLVETLTQSRRGISATASYWNYAPEVHLNEVLEPYGCSVTFRDASHGAGGANFEIELEDAGGSSHRMRFEYPDTPLGDDNLPALLDAVENELLASTELTFALLAPVDRRWRIVLIEEDRLEELERRHGERIQFAGHPLVRADQPPAFASGEASEVFPAAGETESGTGRTRARDLARERSADAAELFSGAPDAASPREGGDARSGGEGPTGAEPEALLAESPADIAETAGSSPEGSTVSGVEASDQDLRQVFGDLSDVSLEPTAPAEATADVRPDDPPVLELGTGADAAESAASGADDDSEPEGLDDLFEELERTAITGDEVVPSAGTAMLVDAPRPGFGDADTAGGDGDDAASHRAASAADESAGADDAALDESASAADATPAADRSVDELLAGVDSELAAATGATEDLDDRGESAASASGVPDADAADGFAAEEAASDDADEDSASDDETGEFEWLSDAELAER